jgi:DNA-binding XRE family transcriptional regulator
VRVNTRLEYFFMMEKIRRNRFAEKLKALRIGAGLNQIALAKLLGIAQPAVARYETGVREPDLDDLMTIAERLGTTPNDLLGFESPPQSAAPGIKVGDIQGSFNVVGDGNTVVAPPSSSSSTKKGKRK